MKNKNTETGGDPKLTSTKQESKNEDHKIIRQVLDGDVNAYGKLVKKHQQAVFNLLTAMLRDQEQARELTQQAFVQSYEALGSFRFRYKYFSWLYRIAINLALNELKKRKKYVGLDAIRSMKNEEMFEEDEKKVMLNKAIGKLKEKYRLLISMKYDQDMTYHDIAETLGIPEKKVKSRLFDARVQLKEMLVGTGYF